MAALALAFVAGAAAQAATPVDTIAYGKLSFRPCTLAQKGQAQTVSARCAQLRVPENRARRGGHQIEIAIAWIPSTGREAAPDPVVMLAGGPGQSALESFPMLDPAFRELLRERDVLLVDQRGTGKSHPLECPRTLDAAMMRKLDVIPIDEAKRLTAACRDEIGSSADLRAYTTGAYVADLEDVRKALGVAQFNLVGVSYGTRVALEYLRRHPDSLRALVLDSPVPPTLILGSDHAQNLEHAVDAQFALCTANAACARKFGSPRQKLDELRAQLRAEPQSVAYRDPVTNEALDENLTETALESVVRFYAYSPPLFGMLPMLLTEALGGRYDNLMAQSRMMLQLVGEQIYLPLELSVSCAEDAPWLRVNPADANTMLGTEFVEYTLAQCSVWPRGSVPADFHQPVRSSKPVLLLSGDLDPVTPPRYGAEIARTLPNARPLVLRGQGHGVMGVGCTPRLLAQFVALPDPRALDATCLDQLQYSPPMGGAYGWDP